MATTVLVVEDEQKLRELVRSYLERAGFAVLSTGSGADAISMALSAGPDLVILDLGLPDVPGESVAREIRVAGSTPILMLTCRRFCAGAGGPPVTKGWSATAAGCWSSTSPGGRPRCEGRRWT